MSSQFNTFRNLHHTKTLFVLPNAWDARSAALFQQQGYAAVGTSSAAVAAALGYNDGEEMSFEEYFFVIKRILASIQVPFTADIEMGYGKSNEAIYNNIAKLVQAGVAGINIEDSIIQNGKRTLNDAATFAKTIEYIKGRLAKDNLYLFINIRCDTYILNIANKQQETGQRLALYNNTGADGIFLPCITAEDDIAHAVSHTKLPLNVMCIPGLPGFDVLNKLGVKRASMGPFFFNKVYDTISRLSQEINNSDSFAPLL